MKPSYRLLGLVTACAALLVVFAALRLRSAVEAPAPPLPPHRFGRPTLFTGENKEKVRQQIGITAEQQGRIEALYAQSDRLRADLRARLSTKMRESRVVYETYVIDTARETALRQEIARIQDDLYRAHGDTERKLRDILTPEQFARLHVLLRQQRDLARRDFRAHRSTPFLAH